MRQIYFQKMLRKVIGVIAGLVVAMFIITIVESLNAKFFPLPKGMDVSDREAMQAYISSLPSVTFLIVLSGYLLGSFFCGLIIRLISKSNDNTSALLAGIGLTTVGIVNFFSFEHPWWVIIVGLLIFIPATLFGFNIARRK